MHWDAENTKKQGAYQTVNAKLGYEGEHYELYLWGKNLFDAVYVTRAFKMNNTWYGRAGDPDDLRDRRSAPLLIIDRQKNYSSGRDLPAHCFSTTGNKQG